MAFINILKIIDMKFYQKRDRVKMLWGNILCSYEDLVYALGYRLLIGDTKNEVKGLFGELIKKEFLKVPFFSRKKWRVNYIVRIELIGDVILKKDSDLRNLHSETFKINFNYEIKQNDLRNKNNKFIVLTDFVNFCIEKISKESGFKSSEVIRFTEIVTDISYKVTKK